MTDSDSLLTAINNNYSGVNKAFFRCDVFEIYEGTEVALLIDNSGEITYGKGMTHSVSLWRRLPEFTDGECVYGFRVYDVWAAESAERAGEIFDHIWNQLKCGLLHWLVAPEASGVIYP